MSGLVGYDNSDDDEEDGRIPEVEASTSTENTQPEFQQSYDIAVQALPEVNTYPSINGELDPSPLNGSLQGPSLSGLQENGTSSAPQSPYSANRFLMHDLTLAMNPKFDIPPSPPGSPLAGMDKKFEHFLELKKQGMHFNEKLAGSSALKNPSLLRKLMTFAGIDECGQYVTTLPKDIWDPAAFPAWAYKEELAKSQQEVLKMKEEERSRLQRESIEFVPGTKSGLVSKEGTSPFNAGANIPKGSAAERVVAGLNPSTLRSPIIAVDSMRGELERRGGKNEGLQHRSNVRKRSRSR